MSASEPVASAPVAVVLPDGPVRLLKHYRWAAKDVTLCGKAFESGEAATVELPECMRCRSLRDDAEIEAKQILDKWRRWHGLPD